MIHTLSPKRKSANEEELNNMEKYLNALPGVLILEEKEYYLTISVLTEITLPEFKEYTLFYKHEDLFDVDADSDIKWFTSNKNIFKGARELYEKLQREGYIEKRFLDNRLLIENELFLN